MTTCEVICGQKGSFELYLVIDANMPKPAAGLVAAARQLNDGAASI